MVARDPRGREARRPVLAGTTSDDLERVRMALDPWEPRTAREAGKLAGVPPGFATPAVEALILAGQARLMGTEPGRYGHTKLYCRGAGADHPAGGNDGA